MEIEKYILAGGQSRISAKPIFEVVSPVGKPVIKEFSSVAPILDLNGKKIGLIWNDFKSGNLLLEALKDLLSIRYKNLEFITFPSLRERQLGDDPETAMKELAKKAGIDAAIVAIGA
jgi:hypothetical protein